MNNVEQHKEICDELNQLYEKKNSDYGSAIEKGVNELGWCYLYSQLWNKVQRFINLTSNDIDQKVDENLEDTLLDLANYSIEGARILRDRRLSIPPELRRTSEDEIRNHIQFAENINQSLKNVSMQLRRVTDELNKGKE